MIVNIKEGKTIDLRKEIQKEFIKKATEWLENNIDKYAKAVLHSNGDGKLEEKIVLTKSFKEDFMKAIEE